MTERLDPAGDAGAEMKNRLRADLREAMKGGRASEAALIRVLLAAIANKWLRVGTSRRPAAVDHDDGTGRRA